jgi:hypothetical protein
VGLAGIPVMRVKGQCLKLKKLDTYIAREFVSGGVCDRHLMDYWFNRF